METSEVFKAGESCLRATLRRDLNGLSIRVKVHPRIEDFVRSLGSGDAIEIHRYGRHWLPMNKTDKLYVYDLQQPLSKNGRILLPSGLAYRIDIPGRSILDGGENIDGNYGQVLNLAFIRLVGASKDAGVQFRVDGVFTVDAMRQMQQAIGEASVSFYTNFLKPVELDVAVSTQEYAVR